MLTVEGIAITKPDRVLWPALGLTKRWLIEHHVAMAPALLPHVADHPVTLHRFPEGVDGPHWYQTRAPSHPSEIRTVTFRPERSGKVFDVAVLDDVAALVWAAQIGAIELHPYLGTTGDLDHPTVAVFDLDPGPERDIVDAGRVALVVRDVLDDLGVDSFVKTSGQKGVHVLVPVDRSQGYDEVKTFVRAVAALLVRRHPDLVTDNMAKDHRVGRVLVDWSQNDPGKSTVAPYSLRALRVPLVSTPVTWPEVAAAVATGERRRLLFTPDEVCARLDTAGDVLAPMAAVRQRVPT